jgi:hypothetical protein
MMQAALPGGVFDAAIAELERKQRIAAYLHDPVLWMEEYLGLQLWSKQKEIAYCVRDHRNTAVAAGHGVGKSFIAAAIMAWWIDVHPLGADDTGAPQTFVASTAPFNDQISAILWNNLRVLHALSKARHDEYLKRRKAGVDLGKYAAADHALPGYITGDNKWKTDDGLVIGQGRKPPDNKTDSGYQGLHATYLLAIGDEAAGLDAQMIDALGNITTGEHCRMLLIANPTDPNSAMAGIWKKKLKTWHRMHISVLDSPLIKEDPDFDVSRAPSLSGWDYVNTKREEWGEDDPRYIARVLGQWAFDAGNTVFSEVELARAANTIVVPDPQGFPRDAWDIARMGLDYTFGYRAWDGEVWETDLAGKPTKGTGRRGLYVRKIDSWSKAPLVGHDPENPGSATRIDEHALGAGSEFVTIDAAGMGSGVVDGLYQLASDPPAYDILEYNGAYSPTDGRAFTNYRAETYFDLKRQMFAQEIDLDSKDVDLFDELRGVVYEYDSKGRRKIESKDDMKRKGKKSPDRADALVMVSVDISPLVDGPLAGVAPGDTLVADPWEMLELERATAWHPI